MQALTKAQLIERYHGGPKGPRHPGTMVRLVRDVPMAQGQPWAWVARAGVYEVVDRFERRNFNRPGYVGITAGRGAFAAALSDLELAEAPIEA